MHPQHLISTCNISLQLWTQELKVESYFILLFPPLKTFSSKEVAALLNRETESPSKAAFHFVTQV